MHPLLSIIILVLVILIIIIIIKDSNIITYNLFRHLCDTVTVTNKQTRIIKTEATHRLKEIQKL